MICISVFLEDYKEACAAIENYGEMISVVELRCDRGNESLLSEAAENIKRPILITCRPQDHGGLWTGSEAERARFLERSLRHRPLYLDVELGTAAEDLIGQYPDHEMILSFHGSPASVKWEKLVERAFARGAHVVKFVPEAETWHDNLRILEIVHKYDSAGKRIIGHCSGKRGIYSRVLAHAFGSMQTYCCASTVCATSDGQFSIKEAMSLYRLPEIRRSWRVYGIAGLPVSHSKSPLIMNRAFDECSIDAVYLPFEVDNFDEFISFADEASIVGLSVTAPYKSKAFEAAIRKDDVSAASRSANTLLWSEEGYHAANTDGFGFLAAFEDRFGSIKGKKILILGSGGAACGVAYVLKNAGAIVYLSGRNEKSISKHANELGIKALFDPNDEPALDVIINGTPIRNEIEDTAGLLQRWIQPGPIYIDMNYSDKPSWFLQQAASVGSETMDGLPMLLAQAERQFKLWTGVDMAFTSHYTSIK